MANSNKSNRNRQVDKNWEEIFDEFKILDKVDKEGSFTITSKEINQFDYKKGKRVDARIMAKFDHLNSLPWIFSDNSLSILPTKRGEYIIGPYKAYEKVDRSKEIDVKSIKFPDWIESIDYTNLTSEALILNSAVLSGMFHEMFPSEKFGQTLSNRMGSGEFSFDIKNQKTGSISEINVTGSQIEIDGGYETENELLIVEAKNSLSDSFLVRQLYYPYRLLEAKVNKDIYSVFLQYYNGVFDFSIFTFKNVSDYNSLSIVCRHKFKLIEDNKMTLDELTDVVRKTNIVSEPDVNFPQADSLDRVLAMVNEIYDSEKGSITFEEMTLLNDFTYRQAMYYIHAGVYLGLVQANPNDESFVLTQKAYQTLEMKHKQRQVELVKLIFSHDVFKLAFEYLLEKGLNVSVEQMYKDILKDNSTYIPDFSESTRLRRASTIKSWVEYVFNMVK